MTAERPVPEGSVRATGGLLGVVAAESWRPSWTGERFDTDDAVGAAAVDLARSYVAHRGAVLPLDVANRHAGVPGAAWLVSVAIVRPGISVIVSDALELLAAAGVPRHAFGPCVSYVELAACLFADWSPAEAIAKVAGGSGGRLGSRPPLSGETAADALAASIWALRRPEPLAEIVAALARVTTPGVRAAVGGVLGIRDGAEAIPPAWSRRAPHAADCLMLGPPLVRARQLRQLDAHYSETAESV